MDSLLPFGAAVSVRSREYLPHWEIDHGIDFITYRLADSLPAAVTETLRRELEAIRKLVGDRTPCSEERSERVSFGCSTNISMPASENARCVRMRSHQS